MEEDSDGDDVFSDEEDDEMPDDVEEPDDSMTLVQYQEEARRDALVRKGSYTSSVSPKNGRVESRGSHP